MTFLTTLQYKKPPAVLLCFPIVYLTESLNRNEVLYGIVHRVKYPNPSCATWTRGVGKANSPATIALIVD
jgi:hypothetical protein